MIGAGEAVDQGEVTCSDGAAFGRGVLVSLGRTRSLNPFGISLD